MLNMHRATVYQGDAKSVLQKLPDESVQTVVTSPPYWGLRAYLENDHPDKGKELGLEASLSEHIAVMVDLFREIRRVLRRDGTVWMNYGDCFATKPNGRKAADIHNDTRAFRDKPFSTIGGALKPKDLCMMPHRMAIALQEDGWYVRGDVVWNKTNPMPESIKDRPSRSHEYLFLLSKSERYFYDADAIREPLKDPVKEANRAPRGENIRKADGKGIYHTNESMPSHHQPFAGNPMGKNKGSVWTIATVPSKDAHFATFPTKLIEPCVLAGTSARGACPACGAPWKRLVKPTDAYAAYLGKDWSDKARDAEEGRGHFEKADGTRSGQRGVKRSHKSMTAEYRTVGWEPTCRCGETETVPCIVLDPFAGSGTTGEVALAFGREFWGIELNADYFPMIERRLTGLPNYVKPPAPKGRKRHPKQKTFFDGAMGKSLGLVETPGTVPAALSGDPGGKEREGGGIEE